MKDRPAERVPSGADKIATYKWTLVDAPGEFRLVPKTELQVDQAYQRQASDAKVLSIASAWSWISCGAVLVAERDRGRLFVIDGQHRVMAALKRSDIQQLPCLVFRSKAQKDEARSFVNVNTGRRALSALERFRAAVVAEDETALWTQKLLDEIGLVPAPQASPGRISCVDTLLVLVRKNRAEAANVLRVCAEVCHGKSQIQSKLLMGLAYLNDHCGPGLNDRRLCSRILDAGLAQLLEGIGRAQAFYVGGGGKIWASGILTVVNKGLREHNRYDLEGVGE